VAAWGDKNLALPRNQQQTLSKSAFIAHIPPELKPARKETDKCPICERGKKAIAELKELDLKYSAPGQIRFC
jgi:hypothetical protein